MIKVGNRVCGVNSVHTTITISMEGTALNRAYTASMEADTCTQNGDYHNARKYLIEAAEAFEEVINKAPETPSARTLQSLSKQHRDRAKYLQSESIQNSRRAPSTPALSDITERSPRLPPRHKSVPPLPSVTPRVPTDKSLATPQRDSARGSNDEIGRVPEEGPRGNNQSDNGISSLPSVHTPPPDSENEDIASFANTSLQSLFHQSTAAFVRAFEHSLTPTAPTDSFYLAAPSANPSGVAPGATTTVSTNPMMGHQISSMNTFDRVEALEQAVKAMQGVLDRGLSDIVGEISAKEQLIYESHTATVDRIRAENDQLHIQVKKMRERWDNLKEGARKRRNKQASEGKQQSEPLKEESPENPGL